MPSSALAPATYSEHRDYVLAVLRRRCGWLERTDAEAILHDAYAVLLEKEANGALDVGVMHVQQIRAYLTQTALNKALDERKRARTTRDVAMDETTLLIEGPGSDGVELLAQRFDDARLREIVAELPERQQQIVKLRFFFDRRPEEIQRFLEITERTYRRDLERAMRTLAERFELVRSGAFCESRRSMILALVSGVAGPNRAARARDHLATCPACAHWVGELRELGRQAGAVVPLPVVTGDVDRHGGVLRGFGERIGELATGIREHATGLLARADPQQATSVLSGARPGALAAVVAGCLSVGSTATYCALAGVPGVSKDGDAPARTVAAPRAKATATTATVARASAPPPVVTTAARQPQARSSSPTRRTRTTKTTPSVSPASRVAAAKRTERATAPEFGVERGTTKATTPAPTSSTKSAQWGTEFGP